MIWGVDGAVMQDRLTYVLVLIVLYVNYRKLLSHVLILRAQSSVLPAKGGEAGAFPMRRQASSFP
ncbi:hypothetical protein SAMN02745216_03650 [Desulfatibacillum alkenivorans DSM 16219]|jgi:hypothetical protein|uniref:Uncharacterized protein n=1 Tax=Desulfatibacillum alkenivorans DSM 16219 TaxID=1121393 RepID=A0A1M6TEF6_9BACT|nr:hypothetical protein SAMN02745216_03650 [Desulfatibacillum alkenivorans DSM 16219]